MEIFSDEWRPDLSGVFSELEPDVPEASFHLGMALCLKGNFAGAKADWQRVIALAPQSQAAQYARDNLAHIDDNPPQTGNPQAPPR